MVAHDMHRSTLISIYAIILFVLMTGFVNAGDLGVYNGFLTAGSTLNTATANSMMVLDDGVFSMWSNPGGLINDHHQIYASSVLSTSVATQSQVTPANYKAGIGMFGYLYTMEKSAFGLGYIGRNVEETSAEYSRVGESRNSISYSEITASFARKLTSEYSLGISAGPIVGRAEDGILVSDSDRDTLYTPLLWFARIGLKHSRDNLRWGVSLETPAMGKFTVEQPVNVGYQRDKRDIDYSGALGIRAGIGWENDNAGIEADVLFYEMNVVQVEGLNADFDSDLISAGVAGRLQLNEQIGARAGIRMRFSDPEDLTFVQFGAGGSFVISPEVTAFVSGGLLLHTGDETDRTVYGDVLPISLRAGVIFHNKPE
jgi:hypothetical protein